MGILLATTNLAEAATANLAVSSEAPGLGLRAVLTPQVSDIWRSAAWGATTIDLRIDLGAAASIGLVAIAAPRDGLLPGAGATVQLTADAATLDGAAALDTGAEALGTAMARFGIWGWSSATPIVARYLRLRFTGAAADAYLQLGRVWVGPALITTRQASYGFGLGATDPGISARASNSGVRDVQRGTAYRTLAMAVDTLTTAEATWLESAVLSVGGTGQVFAARLDTDLPGGMFGAFSRPPTLTRASHALWRGDFQIEEDL